MVVNENCRPFLVINGKSSRNISGLLVTKSPDISKPNKRFRAENIDGRDGDIITPLGYSAYDKTIEIALTYDYNIDEVIEFFDSEGKVTFSNEPDKYYRFAIYKAIDFTRLFRFKKAKVAFHCQPFKFSDIEGVKTFSSSEIEIRNNGNYYARPDIEIAGVGTVTMKINGAQVLVIDFTSAGNTVFISSEDMNAYKSDGSLYNRYIIGDYDKIRLNKGDNTITFEGGSISSVSLERYSRWI